LIVIKTLFIVD